MREWDGDGEGGGRGRSRSGRWMGMVREGEEQVGGGT